MNVKITLRCKGHIKFKVTEKVVCPAEHWGWILMSLCPRNKRCQVLEMFKLNKRPVGVQ